MSNTDSTGHGPALHRYLEAKWRALGTNQNAWSDRNPGIQGPTVSRWARGSEPSFEAMRRVAEALDVSILEILVAAEYVTPEEANGVTATPSQPPSLDDAIRLDPTLTERERALYREMRAAFREVATGQSASVAVEAGDKGVTRRARRPR